MFLSMVLPVYNVEPYLAECLDSCLKQDLSPEEYEIICVNDGSTDGSLAILQSYAERYFNVRVITQENAGVSVARNVGIQASRGEYIWFVDSDDLVAPNVLGELREHCQKTQCDRLLFRMGIICQSIPEGMSWLQATQENIIQEKTYKKNVVYTYLMRRSCMLQNDIWFQKGLAYGEDELFNHEWTLHPHSTELYDKVLYLYRIRPGSAIQSTNPKALKRRAQSNIVVLLWLRDHGNLDLPIEDVTFNRDFAIDYVIHAENLLWIMERLPWRDTRALWKTIRENKLLATKYMFKHRGENSLICDGAVRRRFMKRYRKKRIKFLMKHPKRFF